MLSCKTQGSGATHATHTASDSGSVNNSGLVQFCQLSPRLPSSPELGSQAQPPPGPRPCCLQTSQWCGAAWGGGTRCLEIMAGSLRAGRGGGGLGTTDTGTSVHPCVCSACKEPIFSSFHPTQRWLGSGRPAPAEQAFRGVHCSDNCRILLPGSPAPVIALSDQLPAVL